MGKLGKLAIDSTRIKASASRDNLDTEQHLRDLRAQLRRQVRRWQQMWTKTMPTQAGWRSPSNIWRAG